MKKKIVINGESRSINSSTLTQLLDEINIDFENKKIAIAINEEIVEKIKWNNKKIENGDIVEIVHALKGG